MAVIVHFGNDAFPVKQPKGLTFNKQDSADGINISIPGTGVMAEEARQEDISEAEWILLDTLDCRPNRPLHTGPFLTVQRRRRRRKYVRTFLFKDPTLIDDLSVHQTNLVLDRISEWEFNAFILDTCTGGRPLPNLCVHLFQLYGLLEHFNLDPVTVWKVFSIIEDGYHWRNPYHNAVHAADVTQAMHCFLQESMIFEKLTPIEILSALLAAVTHDLDHPGVNQPFLVATSNHLAALYKNSSVLENHHWRSAMGCLNESGMSQVLGADLVKDVEWRIRELVLATDITRQKEFLDKLKEYLDTNTLDMNSPDVRHFILQIALKCADICNPARPWEISRKWSMKVCEEFFRQGDYERQLNLPVTSLCDRYSTSVPRIQTGFFDYVVEPLFKEWHRMLNTKLSTRMSGNLNGNRLKWQQLLNDEETNDTNTETSDNEETEIPQHSIEDSDSLNVNVAKIAVRKEARERISSHGGRSVHFDIDTRVTAASDSDQSDENEEQGDKGGAGLAKPQEVEYLGIPRPDRRRHSIATGLMGIQVPSSQLLNTMSGSNLTVGDVVSTSRMMGITVIRRESLPTGSLLPGRALPSKTILHLQRLSGASGKSEPESGHSPTSATSPRADSASPPDLPISPGRLTHGEKSSCSSTSTVDELLDFTYSLPEPGRSSNSPRRSTLEATDLDELCPSTSILSMSPSVAHVTLQHSIEIDEQRRHLIRQQTCPVVSVHADGGNFNRPRFLSAAAAISPTAVASSSIISQHRHKNKSPEIGEEGAAGGGGGRLSGGSSNEGLMQCCEVISEETDKQSGSSEEASPLEIFVKQFPHISDDNDGEPPRRESGSCIFESESEFANSQQSNKDESSESGNVHGDSSMFCIGSRDRDSSLYDEDDEDCQDCDDENDGDDIEHEQVVVVDDDDDDDDSFEEQVEKDFDRIHISGNNPEEESSNTEHFDYGERIDEMSDCLKTSSPATQAGGSSTFTHDNCTQTDPLSEKENFNPTSSSFFSGDETSFLNSSPTGGISDSAGSNSVATSTSNNNRLATLLMWRNNRVWKSLTEEEGPEGHSSCDIELEEHIPGYCRKWDLHRFGQQTTQGVVGVSRLQIRRGSAPTSGPSPGNRGAQDRLSDPTQYHSHCGFDNNNLSSVPPFSDTFRRGSAALDPQLRQSILRPITQAKPKSTNPRAAVRRGSLPTEVSSDSQVALKWMQLFQYSEDDSAISMKRRSSGGPELFAAAQSKPPVSWKTPLLIERFESCGMAAETQGAFWPGRRRGSLPVEVRIASSVSCSSESESSAGDSSDT
ncbi:uncharacterized protein LOC110842028 isoform X2 [Folsomia candida]|uniref:uncharacterized protein LOC110842028 isoform X2 n=1 Tax=Folsomia candida TaxID=158441 RepID=UPI001605509B|nr:uncharacterized protein LOC110842028 isoform X2 [Folsomia candida]